MTVSPGEGLLRLLEVFDRLEIAYMIGGSGASSVHGLVRTTGDIDMVARIGLQAVRSLVTELRQNFYIEEEQVRTALEHSRSFNVIYLRNSCTRGRVGLRVPWRVGGILGRPESFGESDGRKPGAALAPGTLAAPRTRPSGSLLAFRRSSVSGHRRTHPAS